VQRGAFVGGGWYGTGKLQCPCGLVWRNTDGVGAFGIRISAFFRPSAFGFRISSLTGLPAENLKERPMNSQPPADRTKLCYAIGILGSFLIVAALVFAMRHYTQPPPLGEDRVALRKKALAELRATEAEELNTYGWLDQGKGIVRLPIEEAMKLALRDWQNPAAARSNLIARVEKATAPPPKAPAAPNPFE
jgi:hypothetical protein